MISSPALPSRKRILAVIGFFAFLFTIVFCSSAVCLCADIPVSDTASSASSDERPRFSRPAQAEFGFDAYILGSFPAYGYDADTLSSYLGLKAYNLSGLSSNPAQTLSVFRYTVEHFEPKVFVLSVSPCDFLESRLIGSFPAFRYKVGGISHNLRDVERIGHPVDYREAHAADFGHSAVYTGERISCDRILESLKEISSVCTEKNIRLITVLSPTHAETLTDEVLAAYRALREGLVGVCDYYDFSDTSLGSDSRFFYNTHEFRTALGNMVLARIFEDESVYTPSPFGSFVALDGSTSALSPAQPAETNRTETAVPILLYHNIADEEGSTPAALFEEHLLTLTEAGYHTVTLAQLEDYVYHGTPLPEKPICITFDDGYESNYALAYPLLKKYNMSAAIFYIGWSVGKDTYKQTDRPIFTHFDFDEAREMRDSGLILFGSHTYDMHQTEEYEPNGAARPSVAPLESENEDGFAAALKNDLRLFAAQYETEFGSSVSYFSYPHGVYSPLSERILADAGFKITLSTDYEGRNVLVCGLGQTLRAMYRCTVPETASGESVLSMLRQLYGE